MGSMGDMCCFAEGILQDSVKICDIVPAVMASRLSAIWKFGHRSGEIRLTPRYIRA